MKEHPISRVKNKRGYSTEGSTLLPSVLRPRLFGVGRIRKSAHNMYLKLGLISLSALSLATIYQFTNTNKASAFSLTLTAPSSVSLNVNPNTNNGFGESSGGSVSVKTDSPAGYKLQLSAKSNGTNELINSGNSSSKLASITANTTADSFKSSGAINTWGYKPSKLNGSTNNDYKAAPNGSSVDTLDTTSTKNDTVNDYSLSIAAKIDSNTIAGSYTNTFVLTATANTLSYNITYNLNSGTWSGTSPQTGNITSETVTLDSHSPSKSGYTFKGWCSSSNITNNNTTSTPSCGGTTYQPSGTYALTSANNTLNLYAMWQQDVVYRSYTINYYSNVGSPSNMPSSQSGSAASTNDYSITLRSNTPTLSGYTFRGWCTSYTRTESCSGTTYRPSGSVTISSSGQTLDLYAMWSKDRLSSCNNVIPDSPPTAAFNGKRWTTTNIRCTNWEDAKNVCPKGYHLPTYTEFTQLQASKDAETLYQKGWNESGGDTIYWTSSQNGSNIWIFEVNGPLVTMTTIDIATGFNGYVRCISG